MTAKVETTAPLLLPRRRLGFFPTPLTELPRLSRELGGPRLFIKRDDLTGLAMGGNKTRKLEFLIGEALAKGCDTLVTGGAPQSNHCRQTAAAAAMCGLSCHLALGGRAPAVSGGNLLLDRIFGASIHWTGSLRKGESIPGIADEISRAGRKPYVIPYGGSNPVGAAGFVEAVRELAAQLDSIGQTMSHIVFASSSGGTHAGFLVGARLSSRDFRLVGIGIDKGEPGEEPLRTKVVNLANATAASLGAGFSFSSDDVEIRQEYLGAGYGVVGELERRAIRLTAATEGILLDPVYTARAMGGLIDLVERGTLSRNDRVLFWHTGGTPALFTHAADLDVRPRREKRPPAGSTRP